MHIFINGRQTQQQHNTDLEWKVLYVGSAHDADQDQVLDEILVGPVPVGMSKFVLTADAPLVDRLPAADVLGVTVVLVTCAYRSREFVRIGYYVNNEYLDPNAPPPPPVVATPTTAMNAEDGGSGGTPRPMAMDGESNAASPAAAPVVSIRDINPAHIQRLIMADKARVTKFPISWGTEEPTTVNNNEVMGTEGTFAMDSSNVAPYDKLTTALTSGRAVDSPSIATMDMD